MRILYNSLETRYKTPFGTLFPRQDCRMRLAIPASCQTRQVTLVVEQENGAPAFSVSFSLQQREGPYEWYGGTFQIANLGLYFYYFRIETANETFRLFQQGEDTNMEAGGKWQLSCVTDRYPVPDYAQGAVMYQVFPDRFFQAGQPDLTEKLAPFRLHADRTETPDYRPDADGIVRNCDFYGGNFAGIAAKLPYLRDLGVSLLYLNPIFKAYSNHRYDTCDYRQPDPMLGTAADFTALCEAAHRLGIRVILDGVFSHTGSRSIYFDRSGEFGGGACTGPGSPYYSWYTFQHFPDRYTSWWGIDTLPCVNELDPGYLDYIIDGSDSVVAHWLRLGADGYRLDVADELPDAFILRLKDRIRQVKPDALLIGEVWEDASNKIAYGKRRRYFIDGALDSVMNYPWRKAILDYCQGQDDGTALRQSVLRIAENYPPGVLSCVMNILGTHDTPRILSLLGGSCDGTKDEQAQRQLSSRQRAQALEQLQTAAFLQFMLPGMACIYYGDEAGMEGCSDPFNRRYFPWGAEDAALTAYYRTLAALKNQEPALKTGTIGAFTASNGQVQFTRRAPGNLLQISCNRSSLPMQAQGQLLFGCKLALAAPGEITLQPGGLCLSRISATVEKNLPISEVSYEL